MSRHKAEEKRNGAGRSERTPAKAKDNVQFGRKMISAVVEAIREKLDAKDFKPTLSEFIRLVQLERELADEEPLTEIRVTWCEPKKASEPEP
ncbi:MAG TPA: hypothetical protein VFA04_24400 [Bryobacteraceae bacterium]|nr:hypothetical protein [Bryobacteraceae bacterium]